MSVFYCEDTPRGRPHRWTGAQIWALILWAWLALLVGVQLGIHRGRALAAEDYRAIEAANE